MNIGYVRVSTIEQNEERQLRALETNDIQRWFVEKVSAKDTNRPKLIEMLEFAREGDTIYVQDFSRLARSTKDLIDIVEKLKSKNINLVSEKEKLDTSTASGKLILTVIGAINEFERTNMLERQREGIAIAKAAGKFKGTKPITIENFGDYYNQYLRRETTKTNLALSLNIGRKTLDRLIKKHEEDLKKEKG